MLRSHEEAKKKAIEHKKKIESKEKKKPESKEEKKKPESKEEKKKSESKEEKPVTPQHSNIVNIGKNKPINDNVDLLLSDRKVRD